MEGAKVGEPTQRSASMHVAYRAAYPKTLHFPNQRMSIGHEMHIGADVQLDAGYWPVRGFNGGPAQTVKGNGALPGDSGPLRPQVSPISARASMEPKAGLKRQDLRSPVRSACSSCPTPSSSSVGTSADLEDSGDARGHPMAPDGAPETAESWISEGPAWSPDLM